MPVSVFFPCSSLGCACASYSHVLEDATLYEQDDDDGDCCAEHNEAAPESPADLRPA